MITLGFAIPGLRNPHGKAVSKPDIDIYSSLAGLYILYVPSVLGLMTALLYEGELRRVLGFGME